MWCINSSKLSCVVLRCCNCNIHQFRLLAHCPLPFTHRAAIHVPAEFMCEGLKKIKLYAAFAHLTALISSGTSKFMCHGIYRNSAIFSVTLCRCVVVPLCLCVSYVLNLPVCGELVSLLHSLSLPSPPTCALSSGAHRGREWFL